MRGRLKRFWPLSIESAHEAEDADARILENQERMDAKVQADIEQFGWHLMQVFAHDEWPAWCYTIGLHRTYGHAEIIMFGLSFDTMRKAIAGIVQRIQEGGRFAVG